MIPTSFSKVYDNFLSKITDDMYLQLNQQDTKKLLKELLVSALPKFEFPRVCLDYEYMEQAICQTCKNYQSCQKADRQEDQGWIFIYPLTRQQINIISTYMIVQWLGQQLASIENTRMKYSGADFKFTSQANHMQKILQLKKDYERQGFHLQRLYKRRIRDKYGVYRSTIPSIVSGDTYYQFDDRDRNGSGSDSDCGCEYYEAIQWNDFNEFDDEVEKDKHCPCNGG